MNEHVGGTAMNRDDLKRHCLAQRGAAEGYPFGADVAVYSVMGKMFAILSLTGATSISLKCDPDWATVLRTTYPAITAGYHLNKTHWNSVAIDGTVPDDEIFDMIEQSHALVVKGLTRAQRQALTQTEAAP